MAQGRLVPLFDLKVKTGRSYFIVYSEAQAKQPRLAKFTQWLKAEVAKVDSEQLALAR